MEFYQLHIGNTVKLNSGSPTMTIETLNHLKHLAYCIWIDSNGTKQGSWFKCETLSAEN